MRTYGDFEFGVEIHDVVPAIGTKKKFAAKLQFLLNLETKEWIVKDGDRPPVSESVAETKQLAEQRLTQKIYQWINDQRKQ